MPGAALPFSSGRLLRRDTARAPAVRLLANGIAIPGVIDAEIRSNNHFAADRFTATLAVSAIGQAWWSAQASVYLEAQIGLDGSWQSLVQGLVDTIRIDPIQGTLRLEGRDLTAAFIETRTQETFTNRTSSEIATLLAARHGMSANVTPTTTPVGRYYQLQHDRITLDQFSRATTEWDLLVFLAQQEGFDVYVSGATLNFTSATAATATQVSLTPSDTIEMDLERSLTLARDIQVTVKSWNSRQGSAFTQTAKATGKGRGGASGGLGPAAQSAAGQTQRYVYVRPNLTPDQALKFAQQMLAELSRHERIVTATMPGDLILTPRSQIRLSGTGTGFDQLYYVADITRSVRLADGFVQRIRARNTSVAADAVLPADPPAP
jgi:phage protein D